VKFFFLILFALTPVLISGQTRCDTLQKEIFIATDMPPIPSISYNHLVTILNNTINLKDFNTLEGSIYINFIINCKGEDFDYKTLKSMDDKLMEELFKTIKSNLTWTPAQHNKKTVDFSETLIIKIEDGRFAKIFDSNETSKKKKIKH
jgi:hypothetical protein